MLEKGDFLQAIDIISFQEKPKRRERQSDNLKWMIFQPRVYYQKQGREIGESWQLLYITCQPARIEKPNIGAATNFAKYNRRSILACFKLRDFLQQEQARFSSFHLHVETNDLWGVNWSKATPHILLLQAPPP